MSDDSRNTDPVRVQVVGRQFRHDGEEYHTGDELEVPEWVLDGYPGRIEPVAEPEPEPTAETEPDDGDGVDDDGADGEEGGEDEIVVDPDPSDLSVEELSERIADVDDVELLAAIQDAEEEGEDRTTAIDALEKRIAELEG
ncbi:hypothetical protein [Halorubrum trueperi]|uniref:Uncharacterized protein n=1 Tax=Halorubrum trueperi TaxID=2004704 RepID=A0ABD5UEQ0_9EURY